MLGLGTCIKSIPVVPGSGTKPLYVTFDDGPDPIGTPETLAVLAKHDVKATFFVVAAKAQQHRELLDEIVEAGHAIGNHSLDHTWNAFFARRAVLKDWVAESERVLSDLLGHGTVGFRSPAGVRTPPLAWALDELGLPLVHWNVRFYDKVRPWRADVAVASLARTKPGSIVLLHDSQRSANLSTFVRTLDAYLGAAKAEGFVCAPLPTIS